MARDRRLTKELFDAAQFWRSCASLLQIGMLCPIVGILFFGWDSAVVALATMIAIVIASTASYVADEWKQLGNELSDMLDYSEAFGAPLPTESMRSLTARIPVRLERRAQKNDLKEYFSSRESAGPRRALEMYAESAWWSSELSKRHERFYASLTIAVFILLLFLMYAGLLLVDENDSRARLAELVANIATLLISLGFGRLALQYRAFQRASEDVSRAASKLGERKGATEADTLALMHQYQLARAAAPPLHSWIWRLNQARLNALWKEFDGKGGVPEPENT